MLEIFEKSCILRGSFYNSISLINSKLEYTMTFDDLMRNGVDEDEFIVRLPRIDTSGINSLFINKILFATFYSCIPFFSQ